MEIFQENDFSEDEILKELQSSKQTFHRHVHRLSNILTNISPQKGNFLFVDIIGRIVWNATATAKSIENLIKEDDYLGIKSLIRKLFECQLSIHYLLKAEDKNKIIAKIIAYDFFGQTNFLNKKNIIDIITKIVNGFDEDEKIVEYLEYYLERGPKHWHWSEKGFSELVKHSIEQTGFGEIDETILNQKKQLLKIFNSGAHIDLDLNKDYLEDTKEGKVKYISPFEKSNSQLVGLIGLSRLIIDDIIKTIYSNILKKPHNAKKH